MGGAALNLVEEHEALLQFLYLAPIGLVQATLGGEIVMINPLSAQLLMPVAHTGDLSNLFDALQDVAPGLRQQVQDFDLPHGLVCDGLRIVLNAGDDRAPEPQVLSLCLLKLDGSRLMAVLSDSTHQVQRERLLRQHETCRPADPVALTITGDADDAYEALVQFLYRAPIGLVQTTLGGDIEMINPMSVQVLLPLSRDGGLDNLFDVLAAVAPELRSLASAYSAPSGVVCEAHRVVLDAEPDVNGSTRSGPRVLAISLLKLDATRLMGVISDATVEARRQQQGLERQLHDAARIDGLTGMPNRAAALERIQQVIDRAATGGGAEFAVLFLNCDRFKQINDTLGPAAGDEMLVMVADRLRSVLRQPGRDGRDSGDRTMAARIGGDEFVVLLDGLARPDHVHPVAQRLLLALEQPYGIGNQQVHASASIGVVLRAQARADADGLLQDASLAMAVAKRAGGARHVVFEPAMAERALQRGGIEADLRVALAEGQLYVVYQPVVGLQGAAAPDRAAGVEALVRWRHPQRGIVSPVDFIGVAEESGLIGALGEFVLDTACRQFVAWQQTLGAAAPRQVAVNLSRAQLSQPDLVASVSAILQRHGMAPARLQLEVTESLAAQDEAVQARLHELRALGLTLALDDFGTGYSSLASLHLLPVHTVKIDRSFVSQADTSAHHRVLIEATIRVAASLQMNTVAEGIETPQQAAVVRELGCDKGQGYLFSRPLEATDLERWLQAPR